MKGEASSFESGRMANSGFIAASIVESQPTQNLQQSDAKLSIYTALAESKHANLADSP